MAVELVNQTMIWKQEGIQQKYDYCHLIVDGREIIIRQPTKLTDCRFVDVRNVTDIKINNTHAM